MTTGQTLSRFANTVGKNRRFSHNQQQIRNNNMQTQKTVITGVNESILTGSEMNERHMDGKASIYD